MFQITFWDSTFTEIFKLPLNKITNKIAELNINS